MSEYVGSLYPLVNARLKAHQSLQEAPGQAGLPGRYSGEGAAPMTATLSDIRDLLRKLISESEMFITP
jgi:hypothetical protein